MKPKKNFTARLKAKIACEALRENKALQELSAEHGVHPTQINKWRKTITENSAELFERKNGKSKQEEVDVGELQRLVGEQAIQLAWYKKKLGYTN
jgi:putative transposase